VNSPDSREGRRVEETGPNIFYTITEERKSWMVVLVHRITPPTPPPLFCRCTLSPMIASPRERRRLPTRILFASLTTTWPDFQLLLTWILSRRSRQSHGDHWRRSRRRSSTPPPCSPSACADLTTTSAIYLSCTDSFKGDEGFSIGSALNGRTSPFCHLAGVRPHAGCRRRRAAR
jgi:hypothetical protein